MIWRVGKGLKVFAFGTSLRRRVAYSLAIVRLILVPVIALAIYYLFAMGSIVDRIVSVDAPVATLADRISIEMLDARRAERSYFLLHDPDLLQANRQALSDVAQMLGECRKLQPQEDATLEYMQAQAKVYQARLAEAASHIGRFAGEAVEQIQQVVRAYERDLNDLLSRARGETRAQLTQELQSRLGSLDAQIAGTVVATDPSLRRITQDLQSSSSEILRLASDLEKRSWERMRRDHQQARRLLRRAEWVLGIISLLTILLSVWVSFVLPREVVRPLSDLKAAVDHAATGNYEIEFDVRGDGEVTQLAASLRNLIAHIRDKETSSNATEQS